MKKTIGLFLAMIMVLSIMPLAFAENETNQTGTEGNETGSDGDDSVVVIVGGEVVSDGNETGTEGNETGEPEGNQTGDGNETGGDVIVVVSGNNETNQTEEPLIVLNESVTEEAGVTPDSPLYGIERAMERISLALTFGKSAKAKKGLAHAHERLAEVQAMIAAKKLAKAQVAEQGYEDSMGEVENNLEEMGDGDGEQELADTLGIEEALAENEEALQAVNQIRLKVSKKLGEAEKAQIQTMLQSLEGINSAFKVKVEANKNKAKIKIKAGKGATDEEIATLENALKEGRELAKVRIVKKGTGVIKKGNSGKGKNKDKGNGGEPEVEEAEDEEPECVEDADCEPGKFCDKGECEDVEDGDNETGEPEGNETTS